MHGQLIHQFLLVSLGLFLRNKILLVLDFLGRVYSSFPILHTSLSYLFEPDQPIDSPVVAVIVGIQNPDLSHKEQYQNLYFPNVSPPRLLQLRIIFAEPTFLLARLIQLSVQGFGGDFVYLSMFAQRLDLYLFSLDTDSKKLEVIVSRSISAPVSWMLVRLATGPY